MGTVSSYTQKIPVTALKEDSVVPLFRDFPPNDHVAVKSNTRRLEQVTIDTAGMYTVRAMLPYTEQNNYDAQLREQKVLHVCIENKYLKAVVLPEWGGRLISLYHKIEKRELLHNPQHIVLRNLAIRNAWFAGGIEWNIGYSGHAAHTSRTVHCGSYTLAGGEQGLRIFDFDRMSRLWWHVDLLLLESSSMLEAVVTIYNDDEENKKLYWWTNIALAEEKNMRVLCSNGSALWRSHIKGAFETAEFPHPTGDIDYSYSTNYPQSSEFFFDAPHKGEPWIATAQSNGNTFFEISSPTLPYRKIFCWGQHQGGKNWQKFLHLGKAKDYFEIQAGIAHTQVHYSHIAKKHIIQWVHCIGATTLDAQLTHHKDWNRASAYVGKELRALYEQHMQSQNKHQIFTEAVNAHPTTIFSEGSYWGAVLQIIDTHSILPSWVASTMSVTEHIVSNAKYRREVRWASLLRKKTWHPYEDDEEHAWVIDNACQNILEEKERTGLRDWGLYLHLGVMHREQYNFSRARDMFQKSLMLRSNQYAQWGLIELSHVYNDVHSFKSGIREGLQYMNDFSLKKEIIRLCVHHDAWEEFVLIWNTLSQEQQEDLRLLTSRIYWELHNKNYDNALTLIQIYNPYVREGELYFIDMWEKIMCGINSAKTGSGKKDVCALPAQLDFRMHI